VVFLARSALVAKDSTNLSVSSNGEWNGIFQRSGCAVLRSRRDLRTQASQRRGGSPRHLSKTVATLTDQMEAIVARCLEGVDRVHAIESAVDGRSFKANSSGSTRDRVTVVTVI
jgi:hypothetical protein